MNTIQELDCTHFWLLVKINSVSNWKKEGNDDTIPSFFYLKAHFEKTNGYTTAISCAADARMYISNKLLQAAESAANPKMLNHMSLGFYTAML